MNRKLYPIKHLRNSLDDLVMEYLALHLDNPFISLQDACDALYVSHNTLVVSIRRIANKIDEKSYCKRLTMYYGLQWISPTVVDTNVIGVPARYQKMFDYLFVYPHHNSLEISAGLNRSVYTIRNYLVDFYRLYNIEPNQRRGVDMRLALYKQWGWYQPFDFWSE